MACKVGWGGQGEGEREKGEKEREREHPLSQDLAGYGWDLQRGSLRLAGKSSWASYNVQWGQGSMCWASAGLQWGRGSGEAPPLPAAGPPTLLSCLQAARGPQPKGEINPVLMNKKSPLFHCCFWFIKFSTDLQRKKNIINKPWQKWTCEKGHRMEKRDKSDIRSQISEADDKLGPLKNLNGPSLLCGFPSLCWNSSFKTIVNALQLFSYANEWNWALTVKKHSAQQPEFFFFLTHMHTHKTTLTYST